MTEEGIVLIAYGEPARRNALECIASIQKYTEYPITVFCDISLECESEIDERAAIYHSQKEIVDWNVESRLTKLHLEIYTPYKRTLYLDVDTRLHSDPKLLFQALVDGFDMVIAPSTVQGARWAQHTTESDRQATLATIGHRPLQMQCGVFSFKRTPRIRALFAQWRKSYSMYSDYDQLAFMRALYLKPVKLQIVSNVFNGGSVISHLFGALKR